jgi:hypothetical protein
MKSLFKSIFCILSIYLFPSCNNSVKTEDRYYNIASENDTKPNIELTVFNFGDSIIQNDTVEMNPIFSSTVDDLDNNFISFNLAGCDKIKSINCQKKFFITIWANSDDLIQFTVLKDYPFCQVDTLELLERNKLEALIDTIDVQYPKVQNTNKLRTLNNILFYKSGKIDEKGLIYFKNLNSNQIRNALINYLNEEKHYFNLDKKDYEFKKWMRYVENYNSEKLNDQDYEFQIDFLEVLYNIDYICNDSVKHIVLKYNNYIGN